MIEVQSHCGGLPAAYLSVGLDVGADFTLIAIAAPDGTPVGKPFRMFHDDAESRNTALNRIRKAQDEYMLNPVCFAESTGVYHLPVLCFFRNNGFECRLINPIITKSTTNLNVRKVHNDRFDAQKIAQLGLNPTLKVSAAVPEEFQNLRSLARDYYGFSDERTSYVLKLTALIKTSFPGYAKCFGSIASGTSMTILEKWPTPAAFLKADKAEIVEVLSNAKKGVIWANHKYDALCEAAHAAIQFGLQCAVDALRIRCCLDAIHALDVLRERILDEIKALVYTEPASQLTKYVELIETIEGAGFLTAVTLVAEMGDPRAFSSARRLAAYWGIDPGVRQSGHYEAQSCRMSKRGSPFARRALHILALQSIRTRTVDGQKGAINPVLRAYYDEKRRQKPAKVALGALMHKLAAIVFAVLRDKEPYCPLTAEEHAIRMEQRRLQVYPGSSS